MLKPFIIAGGILAALILTIGTLWSNSPPTEGEIVITAPATAADSLRVKALRAHVAMLENELKDCEVVEIP